MYIYIYILCIQIFPSGASARFEMSLAATPRLMTIFHRPDTQSDPASQVIENVESLGKSSRRERRIGGNVESLAKSRRWGPLAATGWA